MHNELTQKDLQLMREELDYRRVQLRPKLLEAVKEAIPGRTRWDCTTG